MNRFVCALLPAIAMLFTIEGRCLADQYEVYLGTNPSNAASAAYVVSFDSDTGKLGTPHKIAGSEPSRIVLWDSDRLITAGRVETAGRRTSGQTSVIRTYERGESGFKPSSHQSVSGGVCAMAVMRTGTTSFLVCADFPGGSLSVLPMDRTGTLAMPSHVIQHPTLPPASAGGKKRMPRAHDVKVTPDNKALLVADLGLGKVLMYLLDVDAGKLSQIGKLEIEDPGPRHIAFHPQHSIAYVVNQRGGTVVAFTYDTTTGQMSFKKRVPTLPSDFEGNNYCADIHVHPNGKFLYASNRGHDSIAMYKLFPDGLPNYLGNISSGGHAPWSFVVTSDGGFVLVTNQKSNSLQVFRIEPQTGWLHGTGKMVEVPGPVSVALRPIMN